MVFILGGHTALDRIMTGIMRSRSQFIHENIAISGHKQLNTEHPAGIKSLYGFPCNIHGFFRRSSADICRDCCFIKDTVLMNVLSNREYFHIPVDIAAYENRYFFLEGAEGFHHQRQLSGAQSFKGRFHIRFCIHRGISFTVIASGTGFEHHRIPEYFSRFPDIFGRFHLFKIRHRKSVLLQPFLLVVLILDMKQCFTGRINFMSLILQLPERFRINMLKLISDHIHFFSQRMKCFDIIKICNNMFVRNTVRRTFWRRVQNNKIGVQTFAV